jgi:hypothetical protein
MSTNDADISAFGSKKGIGDSGVHLRYHADEDYRKLSPAQKKNFEFGERPLKARSR